MKIPLSAYLTEKRENLKVFHLAYEVCTTPIDVDIASFAEKYGFDPIYDRFRVWVTLSLFEDRHIPEMRISQHIPVHITIRRLNVEDNWLLYAQITSDGYIGTLCNDEELAHKFFEDVFASNRYIRNLSEGFSSLVCRWTNDEDSILSYLMNIACGLGNFFGTVRKESSPRLRELYSMYRPFLNELFKEKPRVDKIRDECGKEK